MRLLLPTLLRPAKAISGHWGSGQVFSEVALVAKLALRIIIIRRFLNKWSDPVETLFTSLT